MAPENAVKLGKTLNNCVVPRGDRDRGTEAEQEQGLCVRELWGSLKSNWLPVSTLHHFSIQTLTDNRTAELN